MKNLAILRPGESAYIAGYGDVDPRTQFQFEYDEQDNFYLIIDGKLYSEVSTAFDFINV